MTTLLATQPATQPAMQSTTQQTTQQTVQQTAQQTAQATTQSATQAATQMSAQLTVFYDRACPFCRAEMTRVRRWDAAGKLRLIDFSAPDFDAQAFGLTHAALNRELHGITASGEVLRGLACVRRVYELSRYGWLWRVTALPGFNLLFDRFYLWFARNRVALSAWLGYAKACPPGEACPLPRASPQRLPGVHRRIT